MNRRAFFTRSASGIAAATLFPNIGRSQDSLRTLAGQAPAAIIHLVADGMSAGTFTCGDYLSHIVRKRGLAWTALMNAPGVYTGLMNMRSIDSMVTDSAAASSSWGSGSRVPNGTLNRLPSGKPLMPLYSLFRQLGWKRGLVTTTEITHATPAGFSCSVESRQEADKIAQQYLRENVEVLLGGGRKFFSRASREDGLDLRGAFSAAGYHVMDRSADLETAPVDRQWLGVFDEGHLPFTIDWLADRELQQRVPSLSIMTQKALAWLGRHEHFILQVEGGRIDHGAHNCDAAATLRDLIAFDEALEVVLEFQRARPDILVIVTTDHGNGNMGMNGAGAQYSESPRMFSRVASVRASFPEMMKLLRVKGGLGNPRRVDVALIQKVIAEATGCQVPASRAALYKDFLENRGSCLYEEMNSEMAQLGQLLANYTGVGWTGGVHTADYVPLTALGPGAERFSGFLQNVDLFRHYTELANIDYRNPEEPLIANSRSAPARVENTAEYSLA